MAAIGHGRTPILGFVLLRLKSFLRVCLVVVVCRSALAARSQAHVPDARTSTPAEPRRLAFRFDFAHPGRIHISLETTSPATGTDLLDLPSHWADAHDLERAVADLKITGSEVSLEPTGKPSRLTLHAKPGTLMRLDYDLVQDWSGPFRPSERHRVLLRPELSEFNGENGLVAPRLDPAAPVLLSFDFLNLPAGHTLVTSFGTSAHQTMTGTWSDVRNALFVVGELSTRQLSVHGGPVLLAVAGHWSFSDQELALKVHQILAAERAFWQTSAPPWYAVVLAPFDPGTSGGGGGSAFTHAFSLFLGPSEPFGPETESLVAHEAFHAWNPGSLGTVPDPQKLAWFIEGFTTFYADLLLERGGLIDRDRYLDRLNLTLREYQLAPAPGSAGSSSSLDDDETRYHDPYVHGAIIALWLNAEISRQTAGRSSLDDLMRALAAGSAEPLTTDRIVLTASRFVNPQTVAAFEQALIPGAAVPLPAALGPCVTLEPRPVFTFALGLPSAELVPGTVLHDVDPGSAAFRAGVRDGQTLLGWSVWHGDSGHPVALTVRTTPTGPVRRISYMPRGDQRTVPQASLRFGCSSPVFP